MRKLGQMILALSCLLLVAAAGQAKDAAVHPDSSSWKNLFAADLSDALFPAGVWSVTDGVLTATKDEAIWTKDAYGDAIIDLEFKTAEGTNSGVIVYGSDMQKWIPNSVEIQIADDFAKEWADHDATWHCGAIFGRHAPTKSLVKKPGEWNRMTVTCKGPMLTVALNGEVVNTIDMRKWTSPNKNPDGSDIPPWLNKPLASLPLKGHIGLQGKHAGAPIYFRNMKIKAL